MELRLPVRSVNLAYVYPASASVRGETRGDGILLVKKTPVRFPVFPLGLHNHLLPSSRGSESLRPLSARAHKCCPQTHAGTHKHTQKCEKTSLFIKNEREERNQFQVVKNNKEAHILIIDSKERSVSASITYRM